MNPVVFALFAGMAGCAFVQPVPAAEASTFKEKVLHSFRSNGLDGQNPVASVIDIKGTLYSTTYYGGSCCNTGTVFAFDLSTGAEKVLYSFDGSSEANPHDSVIDVKGTLYGTTAGSDSGGTVFAFDLNADTEKTVYAFCSQPNCADGANPIAGLIRVNGTLYGTTAGGGRTGCNGFGCGTVFSIDRNTGAEKVLYSFCSQPNCADGDFPDAGLIDVNGTLYGTTQNGGVAGCSFGCGTVFSLDPSTGAEKLLYSFCSQPNCADGATPYAGLIAVNGTLYGTTSEGGSAGCNGFGCGTVFSIDPNTSAEKVLYSFCSQPNCADGAEPLASLIAVNGTFYGTTSEGGSAGCNGFGCGTVFSIDQNTGAEKVLYSFCNPPNCIDGANPEAGLIDVNGKLYGTAATGGAYGYGTVFVLKKAR